MVIIQDWIFIKFEIPIIKILSQNLLLEDQQMTFWEILNTVTLTRTLYSWKAPTSWFSKAEMEEMSIQRQTHKQKAKAF